MFKVQLPVNPNIWKQSQLRVWNEEWTAHSRLHDQTHPNIMLLFGRAPAEQPSGPTLLPPPPGFLQLAGTIRHRDSVQRRARQWGQWPGQQGACLLLPQLQDDLGSGAGWRGRACGEDTGSHPAWHCQGEQRWGSSQMLLSESTHEHKLSFLTMHSEVLEMCQLLPVSFT